MQKKSQLWDILDLLWLRVVLLFSFKSFTYFKNGCIWKTETDGDLIHSLNVHPSWGWTRLKLGAVDSSECLLGLVGSQVLEPSPLCQGVQRAAVRGRARTQTRDSHRLCLGHPTGCPKHLDKCPPNTRLEVTVIPHPIKSLCRKKWVWKPRSLSLYFRKWVIQKDFNAMKASW